MPKSTYRQRFKLTTRLFLLRRRIDSWILLAGAVSLPLRIGFAGFATFFFSCIGVYLVAARHRSVRFYSNRFHLFAALYAVWSCGLILMRDEHPLDDRQLGYSLLFALFAFAGAGMVLIASPMRMFVLGSRIGVMLAAAAALFVSTMYGGRIGIGGNQAVFAFVVAVASVAATLPIKAPRWLPNGPYYLIVGCVAVLLSETRSVMGILPIFAAIEVILILRRYELRKRVLVAVIGLAAVIGAAATPKVQEIVTDRWVSMTYYYAGLSDNWSGYSSAVIRKVMWGGAVDVIAEHPLAGVGSQAKMDAIGDKVGDHQRRWFVGFLHVHNFILDELLNHGFVGLMLMFAALASAAGFFWRHSAIPAERRNLVYFLVLTVAYAVLHNLFLHEATLGAFFLYMGVLQAEVSARLKRRSEGRI